MKKHMLYKTMRIPIIESCLLQLHVVMGLHLSGDAPRFIQLREELDCKIISVNHHHTIL